MKKYLATAILLLTIVINSKAQVELNSGGTGAAYTLSVPGAFSLRNGIQITFKAHTNSVAAPTINVSGTGAIAILKEGGASPVSAGDIKTGQIVTLAYDGSKWQMLTQLGTPAGSGTVTSVDFAVPAQFSISGTPLTTSGTINLGWQSNSQNLVLATPNGAAGQPTFRSLVANDIPALDASKITSGLLPLARGGTNASLTATNGGIVYSNATGMAITAAGTSGQVLQSNGAAAPSWTTPSFLPTGTSGQTLRHDGAGWTANSLLYNNGTNIGIGTEYPAYIFNVLSVRSTQTDTSGSSGAFIDLHNTANSFNTFSGFRFRGSYNAAPYTDEAYQAGIFFRRSDASNFGRGDLIFATKTTASYGNVHAVNDAKMVIKYATGNVGIGTNEPAHKLHVEGGRLRVGNGVHAADIYQSGVNTLLETSGQFQIYANGTGPEFTIDDGNANFYVPLIIQDGTQANNRVLTSNASGYATWTDLSAISSGSTAWTRSAGNIYPTTISDNVGIGTTVVNNKLDVEGAAVIGATFSGTNIAPANGLLVEGTVGIGTPSPGTYGLYSEVGTSTNKKTLTLSAFGASFVDNAPAVLEMRGGTNTIGAEVGVIDFIHTSSGSIDYNFARISAHREDANATYSSLRFYTRLGATLSEAMRIDQNTNVGIGTTTPGAKLHVLSSTASATEKVGVYGTVTGTGGGANVGVRGYATGSTLSNYGVHANAYGNSGTKYGVYSAATGTGTNTAGYFTATGGTTNYAIVVPSGGGNVGIGVNPGFPLDVRTSTEDRVGYFFNDKNTTNNTFGIYAGAHGTGSGEKRGGSFEAVNGTGTNIGVRGMASGGAVNWAGYFDVGNVYISDNLGIGVSPSYKLHVQLASTGTLAYFDNNTTIGGTALNANVNTTATGAGTRYGLNATAWYGQGANYGVYSYGYGGTTSYGIYATSGGATTNYAGYFSGGDVYINNNLGIGTTAPAYQLQLSTNSAAKPTSSTWTIVSDARLKKDIKEYSEGLKEVLAIHPVWFTYTGEAGMPQETGVGILAQELQKVAPHMVKDWTYVPSKKEKLNENGAKTPRGAKEEEVMVPDYENAKTYLSVDNGAMTYMLINAIKEQQKMIDELKKKIEALEKK